MLLGIRAPSAREYFIGSPGAIAAFAQAAESAGFHSIWAPEHALYLAERRSEYPYAPGGARPALYDMLDPFATLAFAAAVTSRIRLGTGVTILPQRNPFYTAKEVATLDVLSGGRFDFGIGVGWQVEEATTLGVPAGNRRARTLSYLAAMRCLWTQPVASYSDRFLSFDGVIQQPRPVQSPHPPVHFGGNGNWALAQAATHGQGWYGAHLSPGDAAVTVTRLTSLLEAAGRRRSDLLITVSTGERPPSAKLMEQYHEAGVDQVVLSPAPAPAEALPEAILALGKSLASAAKEL